MRNLILLSLATSLATMVGCTGSRTMYDNNGLKIVQTGADPTLINGGYNVLVAERNGESTILTVTATSTVAEQIAMPAATAAGAIFRNPDTCDTIDNSVVVADSDSRSKSRSTAKSSASTSTKVRR